MEKDITLQNKSLPYESKQLFNSSPEDLLKKHLSSTPSSETGVTANHICDGNCVYCRQAQIDSNTINSINNLLKTETNGETNPSSGTFDPHTAPSMTPSQSNSNTNVGPNLQPNNSSSDNVTEKLNAKIAKLAEARKEFEKTNDITSLKSLFPYLKSIENDQEKITNYKNLAKEFLTKAKFYMTDETFNKETKMEDLKNLKPMNEFMANLVVASILELYDDPDKVRVVLDRPEGFKVIALSKEPKKNNPAKEGENQNPTSTQQGGRAVGMFSGKENAMYLDGTSVIISLLNLEDMGDVNQPGTPAENITSPRTENTSAVNQPKSSDTSNISQRKKIEQFAVPVHEFTHAFDGVKDSNDNAYHSDAILPGMTTEDIETIKKAYEVVKTGQTGVHPYGKIDEVEFLATAAETFLDHPYALAEGPKELQDLYATFKKYFHRDPIKALEAIA